jgi:tungstate transport system permease protein
LHKFRIRESRAKKRQCAHTDDESDDVRGRERELGDVAAGFSAAFGLIASLDPAFYGVVGLSLAVTLTAVALAALIGVPLGAILALSRFPGRAACVVLLNAAMGLPPVVVGLALFLLLSRSGPLGGLGWLFTPKAMIAAQALLALPIVAALTRQSVEDLWIEYRDHLTALGQTGFSAVPTLIWDARFSLATAVLAGFGRASAEVGAVLIVGGNILGHTRVMTTAIALETSKGDLPLALGLGLVLLTLTLAVNAAAYAVSRVGARMTGAPA